MDRLMDAVFGVFDRSVLLMGPFLLLGGSSLVCIVGVLFYATPFVSQETHSFVSVVTLNLLGLWLWFNILFNWFMCWRTHPGMPPREAPREVPGGSLCQKCDAFKPPRAHHCHVCRRCVLAMDHHCPWMANCIGFYNYRYFVLTLVYLTVGSAFVALIAAVEFGIAEFILTGRSTQEVPRNVSFVFFLCISAGAAVGMLLGWHLYLVLTGQTTIEFYQRRSTPATRRRMSQAWFKLPFMGDPLESNDYDLGMSENWARVFGDASLPLRWTLPSLSRPQGDGIQWKSCRSLVSLV